MKLFLTNTSTNSQLHCLIAQTDIRPKLAKELVLPTHGQIEIKHETLMRYIKYFAKSANYKGGTFNKHCNGLIGNHFEMPNVYTPNRYNQF